MLDDRAHFAGLDRGGAALLAVFRILDGSLCGAVGDGDALDADGETGCVHHDEHDIEAAVLFAEQVADRAVLLAVLHHAGGRGVDAELVLDAGADDVVAAPKRAIGIDEILRHDEQRDAARAGRRVGQAREHEVDDVVRHLVVAVGDEDLGAEDAIGAVGLLLGLGAEVAEIRTGVRFGQVHGAGPLAGDHLGEEDALLLLGAVGFECVDRAVGEQRAEAEGEVGGVPDLTGRHGDDLWQALAAVRFLAGERRPTGFGEGLVGFLPALWRVHDAVDELGAFAVAGPIQWFEDLGAELAGFGEDGFDGVHVDRKRAVGDEFLDVRG